MKIISKPKAEAKVLASVKKDAKPEEIRRSLIAKAECCVDHLCGCSCKHSGC